MSKTLIYHNPRCRKSREALQYLEIENIDHEIIYYLKTPLTSATLKTLLKKLQIQAVDLIRKNETVWKTTFAKKQLTEDELITVMINHPKLIERPIIVKDEKAVIARPLEKLKDFLNSN